MTTIKEIVTAGEFGDYKLILGYDGTNWRPILIDSSGHGQVDVVTSALPAGAATAAKQLADGHSVSNAKLTAWDNGSDKCKVVEQNLDGDGLIQQSQHLKAYNYGTSAWDSVGITAAHELKISMTGLDAYILKSLFNANTIIVANIDDTPAALTLDEQRILGRITGGNITGLTAAQLRTLINVENGSTADQTKADIDALEIDAGTVDDKNPGSANGLATLDASSLLVESLNANKISAGDLAAARMSTNVVSAIASLDPTLTTLTFDENIGIKRSVDDSNILFASASSYLNGAYMNIFGGDEASNPGDCWFFIGDKRASKTPNSSFEIKYNSDGGMTTILVIDKNGKITTSGVYDDAIAGTANVIVDASGHLQRATSNEKYKKNIKDLSLDTSKIFELKPRTFDWEHKITELKDIDGKITKPEKVITKNHVGLIAEEVEKTMPECASHNIETGEPDGIEWNTIVTGLIAEVRKLREEVNQLKNRR